MPVASLVGGETLDYCNADEGLPEVLLYIPSAQGLGCWSEFSLFITVKS